MPEVSAAIVALAGTVLIGTGVMPSPLTEASRQRLVGMGYLLLAGGIMAWLISFVLAVIRLAKSVRLDY